MRCRALGYSFELAVDNPRAADQVRLVLDDLADQTIPDCSYRICGGAGDEPFLLFADDLLVARRLSLADAVDALLGHVNQRAIGTRPNLLGLHAAAVSRQGVAVLIPGASAAGKSTMAAALTREGCEYLTDEAAFVDLQNQRIEPYPKPLTFRPGTMELLHLGVPSALTSNGCEVVAASHIGGRVVESATRVRSIVLVSNQPGRELSLQPVSRAEALVEIANNSFNFVHHGGEWLEGLRDLVKGSSCWRLSRGDVDAAAQAIIGALRAPQEVV